MPEDEDQESQRAELRESPVREQNSFARKEQTRMHEGNALKKKILFAHPSIAPVQGASCRQKSSQASKSNKDSLMNAQSYDKIGSDEENRSARSSQERSKANMISFMTSLKDKNTPNKEVSLQAEGRKEQQKRTHSSSVHTKLNMLGSSFSQFAQSLIPGRSENQERSQAEPGTSSDLSPDMGKELGQ